MKLDFSKEDLKGTCVPIFGDSVWVAGEMHHPAGISNLKWNNRSFIFRLTLQQDLGGVSKGQEALFIMGLGKQPIVDGVKVLEQQTGLKAVALLCNGGDHHLAIRRWYDAFPKMAVWVCPTRVPITANGQWLMENYPDRWELADNTTNPHHVYQLEKFFGDAVDCVLFNQLYVYSDKKSKECNGWCHWDDEPKPMPNSHVFTKLLTNQFQDVSCPLDETILFHKETKMIVHGHHVEFIYAPKNFTFPEEMKPEGWAFRFMNFMMISPGRYSTPYKSGDDPRIRDPKIHAAQWQEVMKWDFAYATGHHDPPGICGPMDDPVISQGDGGLKGHLKRELEESGELTGEPVEGSWYPYRKGNAIDKLLRNEPGFLKQYGELPVLRFGGPGYDKTGLKV